MAADGSADEQVARQEAVQHLLAVVGKYAPRAVVAVSLAATAMTLAVPAQINESSLVGLFSVATGVGINLLSNLIGDLVQDKRADDAAIMARLAEIFPLDALPELLAANRELVRQVTRLAAWQHQIKAVIDQDHQLEALIHKQLVGLGVDVAAMGAILHEWQAHGARREDVVEARDDIKSHIDLLRGELTGLRPGGRTAAESLWQFLTVEERRRLTAILSELTQIAIDGAGGRQSLLNNNGLGRLIGQLPMNDKAEVFAGELVRLAETAGEALDDPAGLHPLGAVCGGVLRLDDAPRDDRPFLGGLILRYALAEAPATVAELAAEFGAPAVVTPWRKVRREIRPAAEPEPGERAFAQPPSPREGGMMGRDLDVAWVRRRLLNEGSAAVAGLQGMGGIGKSELAKVLAVDPVLSERFGGRVAWIDCGDSETAQVQELMAAEFRLRLPEGDEKARGMALRGLLGEQKPALIILDDIRKRHKPTFAAALQPPTPPHALLVTTRLTGVLPDAATRVLGVLDEKAARELLAQAVGDEIDLASDPAAVADVLELTERVPQAIILAGRWLARAMAWASPPAAPLAALRDALRARRAVVLHQDPTQRHLSLRVAFDLSYNDLPEDDRRRLRQLGVFGRRYFYLAALMAVWGEDEAVARRGVAALEEAGLLQPYDEEAWWLHDVLRDYAAAYLAGDVAEASEVALRQAGYVERVLDDTRLLSLDDWAWLASFRPEIERAGEWLLKNWREFPVEAAGLAVSLGNKLYSDPTAEPVTWLRAGLAAARAGERPAYEAQIASKLAPMLEVRGRYEEAEELYRASLAVFEGLGDSRGVAVTQSSLANLLRQRGQYDEAERLYRASLAVKEGLGDSRGVAVTQLSLAGLLSNRGQYDEAEGLYRASLAVFEGLGDSRSVAVTRSSLADLLLQRGQHDEAEGLYRAGLETTIRIRDLQGVAVIQARLGQLALARGEREAAREWLGRARAGFAAIGLANWVAQVDEILARAEEEGLTLADLAGMARAARAGDSAAGQHAEDIAGQLMGSGDKDFAALGDGLRRLLAGQPVAVALAGVKGEWRDELVRLLEDK